MTEPKPKDARAPCAAGGALVPAEVGAPLLGGGDRVAFAGPQPSDASLDGLLFPAPCPGRGPADGKLPDAGADAAAPEKDGRLLDSVLDSLLEPPGARASPPACAAWCLFGPGGAELPDDPRGAATKGAPALLPSRPEARAGAAGKVPPRGPAPSARALLLPAPGTPPWPGAPPKLPAAAAAAQGDDVDSEPDGPAGLLPRARALAPRGPAAEPDASPGRGPPGSAVLDLVPVPLPVLPLGHALLAARTRQLLEGEALDGGPGGDFPACAYPPDADPKDDAFPGFGDFQAAALKIKEEEEGGADAAVRSPRPFPAPGASPAAFADLAPPPPRAPSCRPGDGAAPGPANAASLSPAPALECILYKPPGAAAPPGPFAPAPGKPAGPGVGAGVAACLLPRDGLAAPSVAAAPAPALYPPLGLNGLPQLGYQAAVLKDGLPQVYPPYLNYLRTEAEAGPSPQFSLESFPQKICLICGDEASGCHYGVLTCGSCKVFFKRAMEGQHNYLCAGRNDCIVDKIRRKNCPACRLRKCCQAGMVLGGRKFKKFNKVRVVRALDGVALPPSVGLPSEGSALGQRITFSPSQEIQLVPSLINLLMSIEPDVIYAGHDNTKPDTSSSLLTSLNHLGERQLLSVVKWSKSLPGFRNLHIDDQITLIQYSWMSLMVFGLGWRSYKHVSGQMLYFAPDLILNEQRMKESSFYSLCLTMWQIPQEFVKLQVSHEEFLCMKVLLLLNTIPLEGLRSQSQFEEMRSSYIRELIKAIGLRQKGVVPSSQRFYQLTKLLDNLHDLVKQLHLYCLNTFIQSRTLAVEFPEMMSEVIAAQLPKILAGMVKPLLFHKK
ncbi:progesterone receptor [Perognathus longimembris pacificus]|uniref:progesterone receptor n=1 Tax=Perognathus longimembris pacificus TaxID=214514 RepID=UPI0020197C68|nr:progesterone receptor [Perognathus longimembris pacificus]